MLEFDEAKKILNYYGFINNNIEPILCISDNSLGIYATFKTSYGHLSRFIKIEEKESLENFLKLYVAYRKKIDDKKMLVEFDNYEELSPIIKFLYNNKEVSVNNLNKIFNDVEEEKIKIEKEKNHENNLELLNIIYSKIRFFIQEAKALETDVINTISKYLDDLTDFLDLIGSEEEVQPVDINTYDFQNYEQDITNLLSKFKNDKDDNFQKYFDKAINIYENILLDTTYEHNLYLKEFYDYEIIKLKEKTNLFDKYEKIRYTRSFKKEKVNNFFEYLEKYCKETKVISKNSIVKNRKDEVSILLKELKSKDVDELKYHFNLTNKIKVDKKTVDKKIEESDLEKYYSELSLNEKRTNLILSSPIKELINDINSLNDNNKLEVILKEQYYLKKFKEIYEIMSSNDNNAFVRKFLKNIQIDSLEEFIISIIDIANNIHKNVIYIPKSSIIKYKVGVFLKEGYINASIKDNYPTNNRGMNNYIISTLSLKMPAYYSSRIVKINEEDNTLSIVKNKDIITFNMKNFIVSNKENIKVNNYIIDKRKNSKNAKFKIFNDKIYITSKIIKDGDKNE